MLRFFNEIRLGYSANRNEKASHQRSNDDLEGEKEKDITIITSNTKAIGAQARKNE